MIAMPVEAHQATTEIIREFMPPKEIIEKWFRGEEAEWPPAEEPEPMGLRFEVGTKVQCRVGPTQWASGTVSQQWYRENSWPNGVFAPYKIHLNNGKDIYAPQDEDKIIRLDQTIEGNE